MGNLNFNALGEKSFQIAELWDRWNGDYLKHCAGEVIEAKEAENELKNAYKIFEHPKGKIDALGYELADIILCVCLCANAYEIDINKYVKEKIKQNEVRANHHFKEKKKNAGH